ncbi:hypothetical protein PMAYCL1PPCAC_21058 [Pristionchus mayeri]|uniref:Uncharacterized protein n=1 Tax=Pristionchus mayeri TaxID=1317129 RepID=A0AAN5I3P5_9BILA|nr:hypothetical protein PMAYCL1PPCAC_21058 [Pristionchus mayeri]
MSSMLATLLAEANEENIQSDVDPDTRIRARLRASRDGIAQLDALREKHERLMEAMRCGFRLSTTPQFERNVEEGTKLKLFNGAIGSREKNVQGRYEDQGFSEPVQIERATEALLMTVNQTSQNGARDRSNMISNAPQAETRAHPPMCNRSDSPLSISHRSSVSIDSGCGASIASTNSGNGLSPSRSSAPMPYATYRKISMEGAYRPPLTDIPKHSLGSREPSSPNEEPVKWQSMASEDQEQDYIPIPVMRNRNKSIEQRVRTFDRIEDGCLSYRPSRPPRGDSQRRASLHEELEAQMREKRDDAFRIVANTIESTTSMRAPSMRRIGRIERPRSMFEERDENRTGVRVLTQNEVHDHSTLERSFTREPALVDSMSFSQITPPPVQRKFGVAQPAISSHHKPLAVKIGATETPLKAADRNVREFPTSPPPANPRSSSSSHVATLPTPFQAKITPPRNVQRASTHNMLSGVFIATKVSDASRTPPTKQRMYRPLSLHEVRVGISPDEEISGIFHARPVKVLSRQNSSSASSTSSNSPVGCRKNGVVQPPRFMAVHQMRRSESSTGGICSSRGKLQKHWRESEGL